MLQHKEHRALQAFYIASLPKRRYTHRHVKNRSVILQRQRFWAYVCRHIGSPEGIKKRVGVMCFDHNLLLQYEQAAWDEFRHTCETQNGVMTPR